MRDSPSQFESEQHQVIQLTALRSDGWSASRRLLPNSTLTVGSDRGCGLCLVLQRRRSLSAAPTQFLATSGLVGFLCDPITFHSPVAPRDDLILVPLPQIE
jgi:hypothetical protein